jgi:serine/threonine protein kinase/Tol biopolymer transport system component
MTPERWQQIKEVFNSAIKHRPEERDVFLSQACGGDISLRQEVESLIESHERTGTFIDSPAYQAAAKFLVDEKSELEPGQTLGSYEVISFISRGGMGEVYLAEDRRLSRKVALKILPVSFTKERDRLRRFEQEARAASALNHPNIITIYEILKSNETHVIATEFVEGFTLRQRLTESPPSLTESILIAIQIADALAAAHAAGIIHRDIKPENVMLRPDGYVKVLDFGLAKLAEQATAVAADEALTKQLRTGSGMVIGTAGYMSPEQARGREVDARSDIFSLGALLYEMVTQRRPFEGETPSDTLAAILKTNPPPISQVVPETPPELARMVNKALRKDREERYQVVKELLIDLRALKQDLDFQAKMGSASFDNSPIPEKTAPVSSALIKAPQTGEIRNAISTITESLTIEIKRHKAGAAVALGLVILAIAGGGLGLYKLLHRNAVHFQATKVTRLTNSGKVIDATLSPDGRYVVYSFSDAGKQSIWIRQVSTANDKLIVPPAPIGLFGITVSRDGNDLYYVVKQNLDKGTLYRVPILGGTPVRILEWLDGPVSFSPDGKKMVLVRGNFPNEGESALLIANADGTGEQPLARRKRPEGFAPIFFTGPSWSPDNQLIATTVSTVAGPSHVIAFRVSDGKEQNLTPSGWPFAGRVEWLPDMSGLLVVAGANPSNAQVWLLSYPDGATREITNDLNQHRAIGLTADASKLVTVVATGLVNVWVVPEGDAKRAVQLPVGNLGFFGTVGNSVAWTPDGRIIFATNESNNIDLWIMDPDGGNRKQLTANSGQNASPFVSPDGRYIVFSSTRGGGRHIWRMNIDGSDPRQLTNGMAEALPVISPDGKWVIYSGIDATKPTTWKVSIDGGDAIELTKRVSNTPTISPDGKLIAYLYPESYDPFAPSNRIAIMLFEGGEPIKTFSFQGAGTIATLAQWSADGKSILYTTNNNNVTNIWSQPLDGGPAKQVTDFKDSLMSGFAWSRDGKQLACSRGILLRDAVLIADAGNR